MNTLVIVKTLMTLESIVSFLILAHIILSFLPQIPREHPLVRFLDAVVEPILAPFRNIMPTTRVGIDFSPLLAMITINVVIGLLVKILTGS